VRTKTHGLKPWAIFLGGDKDAAPTVLRNGGHTPDTFEMKIGHKSPTGAAETPRGLAKQKRNIQLCLKGFTAMEQLGKTGMNSLRYLGL
jgi:hypothetical protein